MELVERKRHSNDELNNRIQNVDADFEKKKARYELIQHDHTKQLINAPSRCSSLLQPIMLLSGHTGAILSAAFSPQPPYLYASTGADKKMFLWKVTGKCENVNVLSVGSVGCPLDMCWTSDGEELAIVGSRHIGALWNVEYGQRERQFKGHSKIVNSVTANYDMSNQRTTFVTSSDDGTIKLWDRRAKAAQKTKDLKFPQLSVRSKNYDIFSAGIDNTIHCFDIRSMDSEKYLILGHEDTVTDIAISNDGKRLLSTAMDQRLCIWDIQTIPFHPSRFLSQLAGVHHGFEKDILRCSWSTDDTHVTCGSADQFVNVWKTDTGKLLYKLPGHHGTVTTSLFHPIEPIICSSSVDQTVYAGELHL
ncbi:hypothetical protein SNEBB_009565 [Seison nebaliae]|nr:hypothetical protein SNEBB_009565 [Seison nebaliae]